MAVKNILLFPDPTLSRPSAPINHFDHNLNVVIQHLWDTLAASPGVGLAAPQIGILERVAVIDVSKKDKKKVPFVMVNPTLIHNEGIQIPREGCLSVPDLLANVRRHESVTVHFWDETGKERTLTTQGFEALAVQHEMDHLEGMLFLDRVANLNTDLFRRKRF